MWSAAAVTIAAVGLLLGFYGVISLMAGGASAVSPVVEFPVAPSAFSTVEALEATIRGVFAIADLDPGRQRPEAEAKARKLLLEWLSPVQCKQYSLRGNEFEVVGNVSGRRYLIRYGNNANVERLDQDGVADARYCFVPRGALAVSDVMLAQKIALETDETNAIASANVWYPDGSAGAAGGAPGLPLWRPHQADRVHPAGIYETRVRARPAGGAPAAEAVPPPPVRRFVSGDWDVGQAR